jgi:hypothetical protein
MKRFLVVVSLLASLSASSQSTFSVTYLKPDTLFGLPGEAFTHTGLVENLTAQTVNVRITRMQETLPTNWNTALVFGTSMPSSTSTYSYGVGVGDTEPFEVWFFSDAAVPGVGSALIRFSDENDSTAVYEKTIYASTLQPNGTQHVAQESAFVLYPNPCSDQLHVSNVPIRVYDMNGKLLFNAYQNEVDVSRLQSGVYVLESSSKRQLFVKD